MAQVFSAITIFFVLLFSLFLQLLRNVFTYVVYIHELCLPCGVCIVFIFAMCDVLSLLVDVFAVANSAMDENDEDAEDDLEEGEDDDEEEDEQEGGDDKDLDDLGASLSATTISS